MANPLAFQLSHYKCKQVLESFFKENHFLNILEERMIRKLIEFDDKASECTDHEEKKLEEYGCPKTEIKRQT